MDFVPAVVLEVKPETAIKTERRIIMKKALLGILAAVAALSVGTTAALAAGPGGGRCFVDADGDGICDNAGSRCVYADADGDGLCDVCGAGHGSCPAGEGTAFVDADGDGVCDICGTYHRCGTAGAGGNFVDADGDGVCDNAASCRGSGCGRGFQGGHGNGFRGGRGR